MKCFPVAVVGVLAVTMGSWIARGGDLNPPAGPVSPTHKTLTEVEPRTMINATNTPGDADSVFKITASGSYYLTGNITGVTGKHGIEIVASGVTLDLNGFELLGIPAMGAFDGVSITTITPLTNIAVVNGTIRNWGAEGVDLISSFSENCRVEGVLADGNQNTGIAAGFNSTVANCTAHNNSGTGISTGYGCTITGCATYQNDGIGISINSGSTITACTAYANGGVGISTSTGCTISNNSAHFNAGNGITSGDMCTITGCTVYQNSLIGISTNAACTISSSSVNFNGLDGVRVTGNCLILANTCCFNGGVGSGAGIHTTGADNRIEGNNCTLADRGIDVDAAGNVIIKNTCSGNSNNWDVVAGNVILVVSATTAAAVTGNSGGTAPGSADPNANFTY